MLSLLRVQESAELRKQISRCVYLTEQTSRPAMLLMNLMDLLQAANTEMERFDTHLQTDAVITYTMILTCQVA